MASLAEKERVTTVSVGAGAKPWAQTLGKELDGMAAFIGRAVRGRSVGPEEAELFGAKLHALGQALLIGSPDPAFGVETPFTQHIFMRAKLTAQEVNRNDGSDHLHFYAHYSNNPDDQTYSASTPYFEADMDVTNPNLIGQVEVGDQFYVDFIKID